ncbi:MULTISPECIES: YafY family protein [Nocardia]|uniref:helix-turn-helix transcriptional regulator n=1 Tax=Nocardia TaxID=1817 RepID=UPI0007E9EA6B|nr:MULTISPECIES: YafY family protein [Nocardia]MBF6272562.1 YafY family transcriptional regulator [Nocardia nova]OBA48701.1 transcriptional regulator [Nocardia sp. 852002-51101_SCH5132738]OBB37595.1 transcriptional regulator [Nocardia sp. 852002-51244_SCH5132740]OBF73176.1 transcriptional regulator [Mycobacterium sp. 852002-51759_SCH5129042]
MSATRRLLDLLAYLQTGRRYTGAELAARLETSPRTVRRDVERLREYGYPVATQPGPGGFYQLTAGRILPPLVFDDDEAIATVVALGMLAATSEPHSQGERQGSSDIGAAALRAFGKIDQLLPKRLRGRANAVRATVETAAVVAPAVDAAVLALVARAAAGHEHLVFDYRTRTGGLARRRVEPYRQVYQHLRWYLLAWDRDRGDWRTFRLDRIADIAATGTFFEPRPLPAETAAGYLRRELTAGRHRAVVTVEAAATAVADILKFQDCDIESRGPQRCRITTWVDSFEWLVLNLAFLDADFVIEEPPAFRDRCRALAARMERASVAVEPG